MSHIQLLQCLNIRNRPRQWPHQVVEADVEHCQVLQIPQIARQARPKPIMHHNNLIQIIHMNQTLWNTPMELVVRQDNHRNRRVAEVIRQLELEPIVVDENSIQGFIKQLRRDTPLKLIESKIQILQTREPQHDPRELPGEAVVTQI